MDLQEKGHNKANVNQYNVDKNSPFTVCVIQHSSKCQNLGMHLTFHCCTYKVVNKQLTSN